MHFMVKEDHFCFSSQHVKICCCSLRTCNWYKHMENDIKDSKYVTVSWLYFRDWLTSTFVCSAIRYEIFVWIYSWCISVYIVPCWVQHTNRKNDIYPPTLHMHIVFFRYSYKIKTFDIMKIWQALFFVKKSFICEAIGQEILQGQINCKKKKIRGKIKLAWLCGKKGI